MWYDLPGSKLGDPGIYSREVGPYYVTSSVIVCVIVRSTISMRSMLMLGGSGGMPPQKISLRLNLRAFQSQNII